MREALFVYDGLPIASGGAHGLGRRNVLAILPNFVDFLHACTDQTAIESGYLTLFDGDTVPPEFAGPIRSELSSRFGEPERGISVSGPHGNHLWRNSWTLRSEQISEAAAWLQDGLPNPPDCVAGPALALTAGAAFKVRDPRNGEVLPFQDPQDYGQHEYSFRTPLGVSRTNVRLAPTRSNWGLILMLPYTAITQDFLELVAAVQEYLPFKFSPRHWARWQLNSKGTGYYARKIHVV